MFKSAESLSQKQTFKCLPNPISCQAHLEGAFHAIPGSVASAFSDIVSFVGRFHGTAATCPVGTGLSTGGVSVVPSPAEWSWLLPSLVRRLGSDPQQSWAGADTVVVQMVKWEFFPFLWEFWRFVNYFLAWCFRTEIKIPNGWWQVWKRNKESGQPQYFIFDFDFLTLCYSSKAKKSVNMQNKSVSPEQKGRKVASVFSFPQKA